MLIDILIELIKSDLKTKYKNAFLGFLWIIFEPFFLMLILYLVFNRFIRFDMPYYPLYLLSGITIWRIFVNSTTSGLQSLYRNRDLILKVKINRMIIPSAAVFSGLLTGIFEIIIYIIFFVIIRKTIHIEFLLIIPFMAVFALFLTGIANILSVIYAFFKDIKPAWDILIQVLFFLCPIFYPLSLIPYKYIGIYLMNPVAVFIIGFHNILYDNIMPDITIIVNSMFFAIVVYTISLVIFKLAEKSMVKTI